MAELTNRNATLKALAVSHRHREAVILGADTLVALEGAAIGKPADMADAISILRRLQGREHQVCTSIYVCCAAQRRSRSLSVISHVLFRELGDQEIQRYLAKIDPLDKAGAYAAQGHGAEIIRRIRGSYTNVVGLPVEETLHILERYFGVVRQQISSLFPSGSSKKKA